ncbi:hypothetical protein STEG23_036142, partial [Scotinomys teguina]
KKWIFSRCCVRRTGPSQGKAVMVNQHSGDTDTKDHERQLQFYANKLYTLPEMDDNLEKQDTQRQNYKTEHMNRPLNEGILSILSNIKLVSEILAMTASYKHISSDFHSKRELIQETETDFILQANVLSATHLPSICLQIPFSKIAKLCSLR